MIAGDWSNVYLGLWGAGFIVEINPSQDPYEKRDEALRALALATVTTVKRAKDAKDTKDEERS